MSNSTAEPSQNLVSINFKIAVGAIAIYNSVEVLGLIFISFKKYSTLYFWSMVICALGTLTFTASFIDLFFKLYVTDSTIYRPLVILTLGWYGMVTGFALVMYSRLHLINVPKDYIRYVKYFIIFNIIFCHFPTTVFTFGDSLIKTHTFVFGYKVIEKIQMTFFFIQEVILSSLYLHFIQRMRFDRKMTPLVYNTMLINLIVLVLDGTMLIIEYVGLYEYQIMLKAAVYSVKLKLEFYILNVLTRSLNHNATQSGQGELAHHPTHESYQKGKGAVVVTPSVHNDTLVSPHGDESETA